MSTIRARHTPGPWVVRDSASRYVQTLNGARLVLTCAGGLTAREQDATIRVVAAAPDLLDALVAMVDRWEPDSTGSDRRMWQAACDAIAKAHGETPA